MMNTGQAWLLVFLGTILGIVWTIIAIIVYKAWEERKHRLASLYELVEHLRKQTKIDFQEIERLTDKVKQKDDECNALLKEIVKERTKNK